MNSFHLKGVIGMNSSCLSWAFPNSKLIRVQGIHAHASLVICLETGYLDPCYLSKIYINLIANFPRLAGICIRVIYLEIDYS